MAADRGSLVLTDISGYTAYLLGTELEHAQDVLSDLMGVVVGTLQPPLHVTKLEGDAIFSYALDGACGASTLLDSIERSYFAFRSRQRDIALATSCTCDACKQIPMLDLKFIVHHGSFIRQDLAGNEELTGRDVIVLHRLSKNSAAEVLGTKGYVLLTDACMTALGLDGAALGMRAHLEHYDDVGEIACCLEDLGERWSAESDRQRVYVGPHDASFERTYGSRRSPGCVGLDDRGGEARAVRGRRRDQHVPRRASAPRSDEPLHARPRRRHRAHPGLASV